MKSFTLGVFTQNDNEWPHKEGNISGLYRQSVHLSKVLFSVMSSTFLARPVLVMTGHECMWRKTKWTLSSVLTPGVMAQHCSLSGRHSVVLHV